MGEPAFYLMYFGSQEIRGSNGRCLTSFLLVSEYSCRCWWWGLGWW